MDKVKARCSHMLNTQVLSRDSPVGQFPAPQKKLKALAATIFHLRNNMENLLQGSSVLHPAHGYQGDTTSPQLAL